MRAREVVALVGLGLVLLLAPAAGLAQVYKSLTSDKLESILADMNITYKKGSNESKPGVHYYDYTANNFQVRLTNHNGKYLWIDALFNDKTTLDEINRWNKKAKFSRAVLLRNNNKETISLEWQLDCLGGVTEGMVRQYITRFDGEVKEFVKFMTK